MSASPLPASTTIDVFTSSTDVSPSISSTATTSMVAFPIASPSSLEAATATPEPSTTSAAVPVSTGLTDGARDAILATTITGGTFLIALALCLFLCRRSRRQRVERRRIQAELEAMTVPRELPPPPSNGAAMTQWTDSVPAGVAERFRRKDAYIKTTLGEAYPMHSDVLPPPRALTRIDESDVYRQSMITEDGQAPIAAVHRSKPSESWSWRDSQVPATPRTYAPTVASSRNSVTRFRMAMNWVRTQGERITSGEMPSGFKLILPKPGVLKNQASKPNLAPRKLVKRSSQVEKELGA